MSTNPYSDDKRLLALLERWQSGDFSRADEQELQALADSDEFRREAVEGFWAAPEADHSGHLASIRSRLRQRSKGALRISFRQVLTAVAAIGLLVLAVVWLIPGAKESAPIAQEITKDPMENAPPPPPVASGPAGAKMKKEEEASDKTVAVLDRPVVMPEKPAAVADKMMAPQPSAVESETVQASDALEDVDLSPGNAAPVPYEGKRAAAPAKQDAMKKKSNGAFQGPQPAGGWDAFQEYLLRKARLPEAARQNNISGNVRLQFKLDANNQPIDFKILRPLGYGCEEAAIQLIREYRWQRGSDTDLTVDVPFIR